MVADVVINVALVPVSELLAHVMLSLFDTASSAKQVVVQKDNFNKFSAFLEKTGFLLKELSRFDFDNSESLKEAVEILNRETNIAKRLVDECNSKSKVYLLLNCRRIVEHIECNSKEICQALSLIRVACLDVSCQISDEIGKLCENMQDAEYQAAVAEQEILDKIEIATQEGNVDRSRANNLLFQIAEAVGISSEQAALRKEFEEFKNETEDAKLRKDMAEAIQMEQIIALLENADAAISQEDRKRKYYTRRNSLGHQPLQPLQSFYCPITQDVMVDPVDISSGKTFERAAIEKWFAEGHSSCPLTQISVDTSVLRANKPLRKLIEEWRDKNNLIRIVSIKPKLQSSEDEEAIRYLEKLKDLLVERDLHCDWAMMEDYASILIELLRSRNREIRACTLAILCILAKGRDDNMVKIANVEHSLELIVHSLARQIEESKLAMELLLDLSRNHLVLDSIGNIQGCILILVTISNCDDNDAARNAQELLRNLSLLDQNVIQMAKANYFEPLLKLLSSGEKNHRIIMARTLSEIELTDHHKVALFRDGALVPLLEMLALDDLEVKKVAISALNNLSSVPQNGILIIREGAAGNLLELLYRRRLLPPSSQEQVAAIIMHLAIASTNQTDYSEQISFLESKDDIFKLFSLISLTGPTIQERILQTFLAVCQPCSCVEIREKLRQLYPVKVLVQLCEQDNQIVRENAVKLFCCLTQDPDNVNFLEHVDQKCVKLLLNIIKTSSDFEEIAAAMGVISNLPVDPHITLWLLDAGALQVISTFLNSESRNSTYRMKITQHAVASLCRFTVPSNQEWQNRVAEAGMIPDLVQLLVSGTPLMKKHAAISLKQLSESSSALSNRSKRRGLFQFCLATPANSCPVHLGICTIESSFCILEANALEPLARILSETDPETCEAALDALLTLIVDDKVQNGTKKIAEANAIIPIIKLLSSSSVSIQEKTLKALEKIFRLVEFKQKYGASAQMLLVDITQKGSTRMKSLAAKVLVQMNVLNEQSSFF